MAVNLLPPPPGSLAGVAGVSLGTTAAGIKKADRQDLLVVALEEGCRVAGVFTRNRFCAAPVLVCREHLQRGAIRALVVNTGCANAGTGEGGLADARATCAQLAALMGCAAEQVLPFSTGVILEPLPMERIDAGLPRAVDMLAADNWHNAAQAIMTTDTVPKARSKSLRIGGTPVTITGTAKGSGMIRPDMATLLAFIATDAPVSQSLLQELTRGAADRSFNRITVDGDTSTNDSFVLIATGRARMAEIDCAQSDEFAALRDAVEEVAVWLAQAIVRDGEGATKFISVNVDGGRSEAECSQVAYAIAHSPLVKTAFFASDPNLGRILAAIGYAGVADLDVSRVRLFLNDVMVAENGGRAASYRESDGQRVMKGAEIAIGVSLGRGECSATVWTCDFSYDYVRINADYRS